MAILTVNHDIDQANAFIQSINDPNNTLYVFCGRSLPWDDDASPIEANNSVAQYEQTVYDDILYGKLITPSTVSYLVPNYTWAANTVYAQYDQSDANLFDKQFFVVNSMQQVFKCIYNNNDQPSIIEPALTSTTGTFMTGDLYVWKYMYTISSVANQLFTSTSFIPVTPNTAVVNNAVGGTIDAYHVIDGGSNYQVFEQGFLSNIINNVTVKLPSTASGQDNYYVGSSIYLSTGFGVGQVRQIISSNGSSKTVTVDPSTPFDVFTRLDLQNVTGTVTAGYTASQPAYFITYSNSVGYFNSNTTIVQADSNNAAGGIFSSNSSVLGLFNYDTNNPITGAKPFKSISDNGVVKTGNVTIGNVGALQYGVVLTPGSGYAANATITVTANTFDGAAIGGTANATANSSGKITSINVSNGGSQYFNPLSITVSPPTAQTFNPSTSIVNNALVVATANYFVANDPVTYTVSTGNTAIGGLASGTTYFVYAANSTAMQLTSTVGGTLISLTSGLNQVGHTVQGAAATANMYTDNFLVVGTDTQLTDVVNGYSVGNYILVGSNANNNFRRIASVVNSTLAIVDTAFANSLTSNSHYKLSIAAEPLFITSQLSSGVISNTNLSSLILSIDTTNTSISQPGVNFITGELVNLVTSANVYQSANAIVAYANSTQLVLAAVSGSWSPNLYSYGTSSGQTAKIVNIQADPNIVLSSPVDNFIIGQNVFFSFAGVNTGSAKLVNKVTVPNTLTAYQIGPTVKITGDGTGAVAIATVNTSTNSQFIQSVTPISPGTGYSYANITIIANSNYGTNGAVTPIIGPVSGHGGDPVRELGARYVGISVTLDTAANENYYFPGYGQFRRIGILKNPQYNDVTVTVTDPDTYNLIIANTTTVAGWVPGEVCYQSTSQTAGIVADFDDTSVQIINVKGAFTTGSISGLFSNTVANVQFVNVSTAAADTNVTFANANTLFGTANVVLSISNTVYKLSNVSGQLAIDVDLYGDTYRYGTISAIALANNTVNIGSSYGYRFNQTARITLTANTGSFTNNEQVTQTFGPNILAQATVVTNTDEVDFSISGVSGSFTVGQTITDNTSGAYAICTFANSSYLKLADISPNSNFIVGHTINNGVGGLATIQSIYPVLVVNGVDGTSSFQPSTNTTIVGQTSRAIGVCNNASLIRYPDLVRESGKVLYLESMSPVTRTLTSREQIALVIKF